MVVSISSMVYLLGSFSKYCTAFVCRRGGFGGGIISPIDIWIYTDPRYSRNERRRVDSGENMNFLEAIFSFVFGDGDPNMSFEERRWRALGEHIQVSGRVASGVKGTGKGC